MVKPASRAKATKPKPFWQKRTAGNAVIRKKLVRVTSGRQKIFLVNETGAEFLYREKKPKTKTARFG